MEIEKKIFENFLSNMMKKKINKNLVHSNQSKRRCHKMSIIKLINPKTNNLLNPR